MAGSRFANNEWPQALRATLVSTVLSTALALIMAGGIANATFRGERGRYSGAALSLNCWRCRTPLSPLAFLPHRAVRLAGAADRAVDRLDDSTSVGDGAGSLRSRPGGRARHQGKRLPALTLFCNPRRARGRSSMTVARSLGCRAQAWRLILWPQLLPRLGWPLVAVFAYGLSVVDMAVILGRERRRRWRYFVWRWLNDASPYLQSMGSAAIVVLVVLLVLPPTARESWAIGAAAERATLGAPVVERIAGA